MMVGWEDRSSVVSDETTALRALSNFPDGSRQNDPDGADPNGSPEDRYWHHAKALQAKGVARSMIGKLSKLLAGDYERGTGILEDTLGAKGSARAYLAKIIRNVEAEQISYAKPAIQAAAGVPQWVIEARQDGEVVRQEGRLWRWGFSLYNDRQEQVGM
jgi:hypothetical protein